MWCPFGKRKIEELLMTLKTTIGEMRHLREQFQTRNNFSDSFANAISIKGHFVIRNSKNSRSGTATLC